MKRLPLVLYSLGIFFLFFTAQSASAFQISPVKSLFTVNPGTNQTMVVKIKNTEKNILTFKLSVLGMTQDENGKPVFLRGADVAESWVYPESNSVSLKAGETKSVNFIAKIPGDALSGSQYLGLAVEPVMPKSDQASLNSRLVSMLTLQVTGVVNESVMVEKWARLKDVSDNKNWKFDLSLKNNGTIEVDLAGMVAVKNWQGEEIFTEQIILGNKLLAGSKRVLQPQITMQDRVKLPGLYQAQVKVNYGRTNQTATAVEYVWYFPMWSRVVAVVGGFFLVLLVVLLVKKIRNK